MVPCANSAVGIGDSCTTVNLLKTIEWVNFIVSKNCTSANLLKKILPLTSSPTPLGPCQPHSHTSHPLPHFLGTLSGSCLLW